MVKKPDRTGGMSTVAAACRRAWAGLVLGGLILPLAGCAFALPATKYVAMETLESVAKALPIEETPADTPPASSPAVAHDPKPAPQTEATADAS